MNPFVIAAVIGIGVWGAHSAFEGVKKLDHKIVRVVSKPFHHKKTEKK